MARVPLLVLLSLLLDLLQKVNDQKRLVRKLPTSAQVDHWIAKAKELAVTIEE